MTCFLFLSISRRCMVPIKGPKRWNNGMLLPVVLHASDGKGCTKGSRQIKETED